MVEYQTGKKGDSYYQKGTIEVTVTKIVKMDPKVFDTLSNKADFAGLIPYYIFTDNKILSYEGKVDGNPPTSPIMYGVLKDGTEAGRASGFGSLKSCEDTYFEEPKVGATAVNCTITLAKASGSPVFGAVYEGDFDLYPSSTANPYARNPIVWLP
ncbi:hypothetical protein ABIB25_000307 [Nakamurella sp. UYEF19]|uniref:hypothetical protein n=1 Tax=Nakamurella sp. UYEF19 TaxID=1756392 RepID=UPI0033964AF6